MEKTLNELFEERQSLLSELEGLIDSEADDASERKEEVKADIVKINEKIELKQMQKDAEFKAVEPVIPEQKDEMEGFRNYLINGETRDVVQTDLGANVPKTVVNSILERLRETAPMRKVAKIWTTADTGDLVIPIATDSETGALLPDGNQAGMADTTYSALTLHAYQYTSKAVRISQKALLSATFDIEAEITGALANRLAKITDLHFTTGDGTAKPHGVEPNVTAVTETGCTVAGINALYFGVLAGYRNSPAAGWQMTDECLANIANFSKDDQDKIGFSESNGNFMLRGKPIVVNNNLNNAVIFGDWSYYEVRDVSAMSIRRLDSGDAAYYNSVDFLIFMFTDGAYANPGDDPLKKLSLS